MVKDLQGGLSADQIQALADRKVKSAATRAITSAKRAKLSGENDYAYSKLSSLKAACDRLQQVILDGGTASGELLAACANVEAEIGKAIFAS